MAHDRRWRYLPSMGPRTGSDSRSVLAGCVSGVDLVQLFSSERIRADWAEPKQKAVKRTIERLMDHAVELGSKRVTLSEVTCLDHTCRVGFLTNDEPSLIRVVDWMSDSQGFLHSAAAMHVVRERMSDGVGMKVYLRFVR